MDWLPFEKEKKQANIFLVSRRKLWNKLSRNEKYVKNSVISLWFPGTPILKISTEYLQQINTISGKENERKFFPHSEHFKIWATASHEGTGDQAARTGLPFPLPSAYFSTKKGRNICIVWTPLQMMSYLFPRRAKDHCDFYSPFFKKNVFSAFFSLRLNKWNW